jgi:hypothetical protein
MYSEQIKIFQNVILILLVPYRSFAVIGPVSASPRYVSLAPNPDASLRF